MFSVLLYCKLFTPYQSQQSRQCVAARIDTVRSFITRGYLLYTVANNRRPTSRTKARTSRQGLPVDDDDDDDEVDADAHDQEIHDSPLLEHPVVSLGVGPAEPATVRNVTGDPWQSATRVHVSNEGDGVKPPEGYQVKGKNGKGGVVKFSTPVDRQPWEKSERLSDLKALDLAPVVDFVDDEAYGVEAKCILPLLRQLSAAMPNGESLLGKASIVHEREVWTCGQNSYGELGHSDTGTRMVHCPVKSFEGMEVVDVAAGESTYILSDGNSTKLELSATSV